MRNIQRQFVKSKLPKRSKLSNKTDGGKVFIFAGSKGFLGAGLLSALACMRSGAGYTHLCSDIKKFPWIKYPDLIVHNLDIKILKNILKLDPDQTLALGPGLGVNLKTSKMIKVLLKKKATRVLLDAGALTELAKIKISQIPPFWILTPHEGELARLLNVKSSEIKKDRIHYLQKAHEKYGCVILLKGFETLIIGESGISKIKNGEVALAKAGSGDVLFGILAAFYAQGLSAEHAAILASYIHNHAAHLFMKEGNDHLSLRPKDLIDLIPKAILEIRSKKK